MTRSDSRVLALEPSQGPLGHQRIRAIPTCSRCPVFRHGLEESIRRTDNPWPTAASPEFSMEERFRTNGVKKENYRRVADLISPTSPRWHTPAPERKPERGSQSAANRVGLTGFQRAWTQAPMR